MGINGCSIPGSEKDGETRTFEGIKISFKQKAVGPQIGLEHNVKCWCDIYLQCFYSGYGILFDNFAVIA